MHLRDDCPIHLNIFSEQIFSFESSERSPFLLTGEIHDANMTHA
jgi:hypothetical protein